MSPETIVQLCCAGLALWAAARSLPRRNATDLKLVFDAAWSAVAGEAMEVDRGSVVDPHRVFGPGGDWHEVATWGPAVQEGLARRFGLVHVAPTGALADAVGRALNRPVVDPGGGEPEARAKTLIEALPHPSNRYLAVAEGADVGPLIEMLAAAPVLRDRLIGVVLHAPELAEETLAKVDPRVLDLELSRSIPLIVVPAPHSPSPITELESDPSGREPLRLAVTSPVATSPVAATSPEAGNDTERLARALVVTLAFWQKGD